MILFYVIATLGVGVVPNLRPGATTLVASDSTVGGVTHCPAMIAVSSWMAWATTVSSSLSSLDRCGTGCCYKFGADGPTVFVGWHWVL